MSKIDYIVVGGGVAGVTLCHHLHERGLSFKLFAGKRDNPSSSRVAAGLFNPITGRKMVKTWKADVLFPYLHDFYRKVEERIDHKFFFSIPIYRPFFSIEEQNDWAAKSGMPEYELFVKKVHLKPQYRQKFNDPYGGIELSQCGWVDTEGYIDGSLRYFRKLGYSVVQDNFNYDKMQIPQTFHDDLEARFLLFAEGVDMKVNPLFRWLPLAPLKGEILDIRLSFETNEIFNRGVFVLPIGHGLYRVGSTYSHHDISWKGTEKGREQLENKLRELLAKSYSVEKHTAGVRPATRDRRPFVGAHPDFNNMLIFNGLGTKGVSLAPYYAKQLVAFAEEGQDLDKEVNIQRFFSLYCK